MGLGDLLDISGPKTPNGIRRVFFLALLFTFLAIYGGIFDIRLVEWAGVFGLDNLLFFGTLAGVIFVIYTNRRLIRSILG